MSEKKLQKTASNECVEAISAQTENSQGEAVKQLEAEVENLRTKLAEEKRIPSGKIGLTFAIAGALSLILSIIDSSTILAFVGLGLSLWAVLFLFVQPARYVEENILDYTTIPSYMTIDRIMKDLNCKGRAYYVPPYPEGTYAPEHLKGLKEAVVFIAAEEGIEIPSIDEMAKNKFLLEHPKGICLAAPGLSLLTQFEKELKMDISRVAIGELCNVLPTLIQENFRLAKEIKITLGDDEALLQMSDSVYGRLYSPKEKLQSIHVLGCPLVSAVACAISKSTGKIVTIFKDNIGPDGRKIEVLYRALQG
jgi:hypothetical protein